MRRLAIEYWLTIDAVLDNVHDVENVGGDQNVARRARRLRQLGWEANARHPDRDPGEWGWAPLDAQLAMDLSDADLDFIRDCLDEREEIARSLVTMSSLSAQIRSEQERSLQAVMRARAVIDGIEADEST